MTISFLGSLPMVIAVFSRRNSLIFAPLNWSSNFAMCAVLLQVPCLFGTDCWSRPLTKRSQNCGKPWGAWTLKRLPEACHAQVWIDAVLVCFRFGCCDTVSG